MVRTPRSRIRYVGVTDSEIRDMNDDEDELFNGRIVRVQSVSLAKWDDCVVTAESGD